MLFKISVVICLNILIVLVFSICKMLKNAQRKTSINKLRDYAEYRRRENLDA